MKGWDEMKEKRRKEKEKNVCEIGEKLEYTVMKEPWKKEEEIKANVEEWKKKDKEKVVCKNMRKTSWERHYEEEKKLDQNRKNEIWGKQLKRNEGKNILKKNGARTRK